jgi:1-acyl-sn-glycerol-3-phosphate acyltransferase
MPPTLPRSSGGASDPVALRSPALCAFFARVMARQMRGGFRAVRLARPGLPELPDDRPVMFVCNHPSWWDPAFFMVLMRTLLPDRRGYGPIDAAMLERYRFMSRIGLFGVSRDGARGAADFLRIASRLMQDPGNALWITAQGTFTDARVRPVSLRRGASLLMSRTPQVVAVPLAVEYPFWTEKRPEALARFGAPLTTDGDEAPAALHHRLERALEDNMDALAHTATLREAAAFIPVLRGTAGVGGIYGAWSRLRAAAGGRAHVADHMEEG